MKRLVYEYLLAVNRGFEQVIENLAAFRQHPEFSPTELKRLAALSKEACAVTNSYLVSVIEGSETAAAGRLYRKRRLQEQKEEQN